MSQLKTYGILLLMLCVAVSCEKDEVSLEGGKMEFSFKADESFSGGRLKGNASSLLISVKRGNGTFVYERKKLDLYKFGEEYLSEPIALQGGNFRLTEFIVLDENDEAIYATPMEGSELAYLVDDPLPMGFKITKNQTTKVTPQVIKIEGHRASQFGYATFSFDMVKTFTFMTGIFAYSSTTENFELTIAHMQITAAGDTIFDKDLPASTNHIRVPDGYSTYEILVTKEGYTPFYKAFSSAELKAFRYRPLVITLFAESLTEGLIAYYPFNGNANDESGNGLDGTVHEAQLTSDRNGTPNSAYSFDGVNDYINVPHSDTLNLPGDFTISLWTKISSSQEPHAGINDILRKWNGTAEGYPFAIAYLNQEADDAHEDRIIYVRYDGQACGNAPTTYSPTITNDVFLHLVLVKQGSKIRHYLNNVMIEEIDDTTTCSVANTADMTIGSRGNLVRFFKGTIDNIRIYGRALADDEISNLYAE